MVLKEDIRKKIYSKRKNLNQAYVKSMSDLINIKLINSQIFKNANNVLFYSSKDNEVNLEKSIRQAINQGKKVVLPKVNRFNDTLQLYVISNLEDDLEKGYAGIMEPRTSLPRFDKHDLDLILVPGVAFDIQGNRVGYGKGYFDKFLLDLLSPKIGIAYGFQIVEPIYFEKDDVKMDYIMTECRVIKCC